MKKRVKLLTTIASLCLAVALMAFGVYAATINDLSVSGTISFSSVEIDGVWTDVTVTLTNGKFKADGQTEWTTTVTPGENGVYSAVNIPEIVADAAGTAVTIEITATFDNTSTTDATITGQATTDEFNKEEVVAQKYSLTKQASDTTADALKNTEDNEVTVTYTFKALDAAQNVSPVDFDANFKAGVKVTTPADPEQGE